MDEQPRIGPPPWILLPELPRWSSAWLEHPARSAWQEALAKLSREERVAYFQRHTPVAVEWMDVVASVVEDDWEADPIDQIGRVEDATGLVSRDRYEAYLASST